MLTPPTVHAETAAYSLKTPDGFTGADADADKSALAAIFGMTEAQLDGYFEEKGILYLAANSDYSEQICLTACETEFSRRTVSFSRLNETELAEISESLAGDSFDNGGVVKSADGAPYIRLTLRGTQGYTVTEYLTVGSCTLYTLRVTSDKDAEALAETVFSGLSIRDKAAAQESASQSVYTLLAAAGIALFATVAVWLTYTVIRDLRRSKRQEPPDAGQHD